MNRSFTQFQDAALKSGILQSSPQIALHLEQTREKFDSLAKSAAAEGSNDVEEESLLPKFLKDSAIAAPLTVTAPDQPAQAASQVHNVDVGWDSVSFDQFAQEQIAISPSDGLIGQRSSPHLSATPPPSIQREQALALRYSESNDLISIDKTMDCGNSWLGLRMEDNSGSQSLPFGFVDPLSQQQRSVNISAPNFIPAGARSPTPPLPTAISLKSLSAPWTYSINETTFARRLTRAAVEIGFQLLSVADKRPVALNRIFKLTLPYMSVQEIRERLRGCLARGTEEELDCWDTPFLHLGGAGTHYPRKDAEGRIVKIPNAWSVRPIGPINAKAIRAENSVDPSLSHNLNIDLTGFEGEWFDAHDIQGYLEHEKQCRIDPRASFAEAFIYEDEYAQAVKEESIAVQASRFDSSHIPWEAADTEMPGLSTGSSTTETVSSSGTPTYPRPAASSATSSLDGLFAPGRANVHPGFGTDINVASQLCGAATDMPQYDNTSSTFSDAPFERDPVQDISSMLGTNSTSLNPSTGTDNAAANIGILRSGALGKPVNSNRKKRAAWVDVGKLIEGKQTTGTRKYFDVFVEILKYGVCLGRSPAFRRRDVELAFRASLILAY